MIINNVERESNREEKKNTLVEKADYRLKEMKKKNQNDCCC